MWLPRPHLTPMTGAYRRIPVLQIGADLYCDTRLIAREIDALLPDPPLYPSGLEAAADAIAQWVDRWVFFQVAVPQVFTAMAGIMPRELLEDRQKMRPDVDLTALGGSLPDLRNELRALAASLDRTLSRKPFLLGERFSVADAAVYHTLWFVRNAPEAGAILAQFPGVSSWLGRIDGMGQGQPRPMTPEAALEVARSSEPRATRVEDTGDPNGLAPGARVAIHSDDLAQARIEGEVRALGPDEIVIIRQSAECGAVALHFPRAGYRIATA
jgi:glutathione S-transferase